MCVCPLHFCDKEKLYCYVHTGEAETKSYIFAQLTRRLLYNKDTYHHNRTGNSILIYRLSFCLFIIDVDAAAVERSHIVMDNSDAAAATRYLSLRSRRKEDTLYT